MVRRRENAQGTPDHEACTEIPALPQRLVLHQLDYLLQFEFCVILYAELDDEPGALPLRSPLRSTVGPRLARKGGVVVHVSQGG